MLRHIYQDAFVLVGVVCEEQRRLSRVMKKYEDAGEAKAKRFMKRDEKAAEKHGQKVADAFHMSDFFVDNTVERFEPGGAESEAWDINAKLRRLVKIIAHSGITRTEMGETAMRHAHSAAMQSACLSRQVGAALVDSNGNVVATGTTSAAGWWRALWRTVRRDGSGRPPLCVPAHRFDGLLQQHERADRIVDDLIEEVPELKAVTDPIRRNALRMQIRKGRVGDLIEFSRAVHAEMDAVLSAGREGISQIGTRLYVTTFPCHYCARHLVSAGVDEVQFIEPYPKSQALGLHADAIQLEATDWLPPSQGSTEGALSAVRGRSTSTLRARLPEGSRA